MTLYWVSFIMLYEGDSSPRLCALNDSCLSLEEAKEKILFQRSHYAVLSAWVDIFDGVNESKTVLHECYVDSLGTIARPTNISNISERKFVQKWKNLQKVNC